MGSGEWGIGELGNEIKNKNNYFLYSVINSLLPTPTPYSLLPTPHSPSFRL
ncbi:MAG: hypothetical protein KME64_44285 [Scytonematopsis contorta HA4267-MV1]|nr:hypothetical protein [Scytonematopsis contorta HA4267-MV1]